MVHSLLLWLAHAESRRYTVNMDDPSVQPSVLQEHRNTLKVSVRNQLLTWDEPTPEHQLTPLLRLFRHWNFLLVSVITGVVSFCIAPPGGRIWQRSCRAGRSKWAPCRRSSPSCFPRLLGRTVLKPGKSSTSLEANYDCCHVKSSRISRRFRRDW